MRRRTDATTGRPADRLADWLVCAPLVLTTFFGKLALPGQVVGVGLPMLLVVIAMAIGLVSRRMRFDLNVLVAYLVTVAVLGLFQLFGRPFSAGSLALMVVTFGFYLVRVDERFARRIDPATFFVDIASVIAICGLAQYAGQFVLPLAAVFPIEHGLPTSLIVDGYNMVIPISFGSSIHKANGIFCLEPSFFSQMLALALLVELCGRNRLARLVLLAAGMVVSYSGTGILLLAVCLPVLMITRRRWDLLVYGVAFLGVALLLANQLNLDVFVRRIGEFSDTRGSSGFDRFVGGFYVLDDFLWQDPLRAMVGMGAGTYAGFTARGLHSAAEMAFFKVVFEYGVLGSILYCGFLIYAIGRTRAPGVVRLAAVLEFFLSNFYVMTPHGLALTLLVWGYVPHPAPAAAGRGPAPGVLRGGLSSRAAGG